MKTIFQKTWNWYKKLPWYYKLVGWVAFAFIFFIWAYSLFYKKDISDDLVEIDDVVAAHSNERIAAIEKENQQLAKDIIKKKKEIAFKLNTMRGIDAKTLEGRRKIQAAKSMDELDKLQKELGL